MSAPLSVLDLSPISEGGTARQALRNSLDLARSAEAWGYKRYWVAEHHFVGVASSSPAVLVGLIAAATNTIRVGSAAVLLGNNTAAQVVEAFGTVEALYPGRIDLGIGRSGQRRVEALRAVAAGTPAPPESKRENVVRDGVVIPAPFDPTGLLTSPRLQASFEALAFPGAQAPDFKQQVDDIRSLLNGTYRTRDGIELHASPGENADVELWVFGSSAGPSAELAGRLGLPFGANYHVAPSSTLDAVE
ncbi:LLM class flavin-dependent oxidoreductase, partial [Rhodococcus sp. (in: high G+C Gram-positive bacteria)]|uniref:LLM class flavin-dependent oxidoreductase n=2 Tax=Nocardiaceae TaxID=85025 RepID=UPI002E266EC4